MGDEDKEVCGRRGRRGWRGDWRALRAMTLLFLDASGRVPLAGLWRGGEWVRFLRGTEGGDAAGELFALAAGAAGGVANAAAGGGRADLGACDGFVFAEGPGAVLGLRSAAVALRAWLALPELAGRPVFVVNSLALAALLVLRGGSGGVAGGTGGGDFSVFAAARRGWWNTLAVCGGCVPARSEEGGAGAVAALPAPRFRLARRFAEVPPVEFLDFPQDVLEREPAVLEDALEAGLLRETGEPDAANTRGEFVRWTPQRHRATA
ncbi:MAG: hypothetical protein LBR07_03655 [Puniceicoccales bacterium]|nr:hypothetical protein [Puniceicoccales bacterium]